MLTLSLSRMFGTGHAGWTERLHSPPAVWRTMLLHVLPFALLPPALCMYSVHEYPGVVLPAIAPAVQPLAMVLLGVTAVALQMTIVALMAGQLRLLARAPSRAFDEGLGLPQALSFAAVVPVPLWLSSLALLLPSRVAVVLAIAAGWLGVAVLVRQGLPLLLRPDSPAHAGELRRAVLGRGVFSWLMVVGAILLPLYAMAVLG